MQRFSIGLTFTDFYVWSFAIALVKSLSFEDTESKIQQVKSVFRGEIWSCHEPYEKPQCLLRSCFCPLPVVMRSQQSRYKTGMQHVGDI